MQKTQSDIQQVLSATASTNGFDIGTAVIHEDGTVVRPSLDDQTSTRGIIAPSPTIRPESIADANGNDDEPTSAVPTIRISAESSREDDSSNGDEAVQQNGVQKHDLERPVQAAGEGDQNVNEASPAPVQEAFSFSNKRLCERWLDNLFMVLYEVGYHFFLVDLRSFNNRLAQDLRVWTIFRAEVAHFRTQHVAYRKTGMEWEVLGDLGIRLHHKEEAKEAYQRCLDSPRYTVKPWAKLMEMYADEGDIQRCVQTAIRVAAYQYAEYTEMAVCDYNSCRKGAIY